MPDKLSWVYGSAVVKAASAHCECHLVTEILFCLYFLGNMARWGNPPYGLRGIARPQGALRFPWGRR
jgi:hypothetical protein